MPSQIFTYFPARANDFPELRPLPTRRADNKYQKCCKRFGFRLLRARPSFLIPRRDAASVSFGDISAPPIIAIDMAYLPRSSKDDYTTAAVSIFERFRPIYSPCTTTLMRCR